MADVLLVAINRIEDNIGGNFILTDEVDAQTGEFRLRAVARVTMPGAWQAFPAEVAKDLIEREAAREPTDDELKLRRLTVVHPDVG